VQKAVADLKEKEASVETSQVDVDLKKSQIEVAQHDLERAEALAGYAVGLAGYAGIKVLAPAFYALGDARTPMRVSVLSMGTNLLLNWLFVRVLGFGATGLALSTSLVALANCGVLLALLRQRIGPLGSGLGRSLARIVAASGLMVIPALAADAALSGVLPAGPPGLRYAIRVATVVPVAVAAFWLACRALGVAVPRLRRAGPPA